MLTLLIVLLIGAIIDIFLLKFIGEIILGIAAGCFFSGIFYVIICVLLLLIF